MIYPIGFLCANCIKEKIMKNEIYLCLGSDGVFRARNPEYSVIISCENEEEAKEMEKILLEVPEMQKKIKLLEEENKMLKEKLKEKGRKNER